MVAPYPVEYSCTNQKRLAAAFRALDGYKPDAVVLICAARARAALRRAGARPECRVRQHPAVRAGQDDRGAALGDAVVYP